MRRTAPALALIVTLIGSHAPSARAGEEPLGREQAACVVGVNKAFAKVVTAAGKAAARCAADATPLSSCLESANTAAVEAKTGSTIQKKCSAKGVDPNSTIGFVGETSIVNAAALDESFAFANEVLGDATPSTPEDIRCRRTVAKGSGKFTGTLSKEMVKRKKAALKGKFGAPPETASELAEELATAGLSAKVAGAATKAAGKIAKKCSGLDLGALFPGSCSEATSTGELARCAEEHARCRFCRALNAADGLAIDCTAYSGLSTCGGEAPVCGDGILSGSEQCDDGNTVSGDGCDATCVLEGEEVCGDGILSESEQCDDGNTVSGDGCDAECTVEDEHVCGDGEITGSEQCDDGNTASGDGCSSACIVEEMHVCGDGMETGNEECDDGNTVGGDGCSSECLIEIVEPFCGDGNVDEGEECDDGGTAPGDGCDETCTNEICGNGVLQTGEACDDGNTLSGDGCSSVCQLEIAPVCGNGVPETGEECDDGNTVDGDGCSSECLIEIVEPFCGDGNVDEGEECDDGNTQGGDACDADCTLPDQIAPDDPRFNNPLDIPLDSTASVLDFVSFPNGDFEDRVRYSVVGMNPNPSLPGGQARLVISATCFGEGNEHIEFFTGGQTFACGQTLVDRIVTADSDTGSVVITAVGGVGTYVQWVLTGTATRTN